jgi:RNA polymerase sigma factor (sigma-70 family)
LRTITDNPTNILALCKKGDARAFQHLYQSYAKAMYSICVRMCGNTADADDVLQEAFVQIYNHLHAVENDHSLTAWIKRIVVNQCISFLRKKKVSFLSFEDRDVVEEPGLDEQFHAAQVAQVKEAINQLPEGYRTVLNLYIFESYTHKEIGELLGISESTVKTQYMRSKNRVREFLSKKSGII